jgi:4-amino-4-deoxy-L-arabinose transferase-like glycosyltransferase
MGKSHKSGDLWDILINRNDNGAFSPYRAPMTLNSNKIIWAASLILTLETLFCVPYLAWELALGSHQVAGACFALSVTIAISTLVWKWRERLRHILKSSFSRFETLSTRKWLLACFAIGTVLRVFWVWLYPAPQRSDQATYFALARGLVEGHQYGFQNGGLAYWPPGFPLFLATWFYIFGIKPWVPLVANIFLFGGTLLVVDRLAMKIGGASAARLATFLLVPWPTMVMIAGFAGKELLVVFLLCLTLLIFSYALECSKPGTEIALVGSTGLLLGAMSLTQPSFLLFVAVLLVYDYLRKRNLLRAGVRAVVAVAALSAVVLPWTLRNHRVLRVWVPISTNGGDVFYRANNPLATGGYTPRGEQNLDAYDEVARGKIGFQLGKEWIQAHPVRFLALGVRKEILFLGDDAQGAFETLKRGLGIGGLRYAAWKAVSSLYWWGLWGLILLMLATHWRSSLSRDSLLAAVILSILYLLGIHSVFESGGKYHEPLIGLVAVLAGQAFAISDASYNPDSQAET